ncbi:hypothetical protein Tco_1243892 [Tanacetum coccineum]
MSEYILDTNSEEDEEVEEISDYNSKSKDAKDEGPTAGDEGPAIEDEGLAARDGDPSMRVESFDLVGDEAIPKGQQRAAPVVETSVGEPLGLGYRALRHRELALREGQMPSVFKVGQGSGSVPEPEGSERVSASYPPPTPPVQTPPSLEWSSCSFPISPAPSVIPLPISSPMISLTIPLPIASSVATPTATIPVDDDQFLEAGRVDTRMAKMSRAGYNDHWLVHDLLVQQTALQRELQEMRGHVTALDQEKDHKEQ